MASLDASSGPPTLPYRVAVLCYLYDPDGRVLLLHRARDPNAGMYSPIGGKLETAIGESPHDCAVREIREEAGVALGGEELHLTGIVAETAYDGAAHWLIFIFEVLRPVRHGEIAEMQIDEGTLEWVRGEDVDNLHIPETDRRIIWPLVHQHRGGFFTVHIDCTGGEHRWTVQESRVAPGRLPP
jgi:8-oxo-dGTP diphosphatase